jgi:cytochrome b561
VTSPTQDWAIYISAISAIIAAIAVCFSAWSIRESRKTRNVQLFYNIFKDILALEEKQKASMKKEEKEAWNSLFFNSLEFFSFLINHKLLARDKTLTFFEDSITLWYEKIFVTQVPKEKQENPEKYTELKKLYKELAKK